MGRPNGRKLTIFVDYVSPYSRFGFTNTNRYRPLLEAHGVSVDIVPFSLGGARKSVVNPYMPRPKWKEAFSAQDSDMIDRLLGLKVVLPKEFPVSSLYRVRVATWILQHVLKTITRQRSLKLHLKLLCPGIGAKGLTVVIQRDNLN